MGSLLPSFGADVRETHGLRRQTLLGNFATTGSQRAPRLLPIRSACVMPYGSTQVASIE